MKIGKINKDVLQLLENSKNEGIEVNEDTLISWIEDSINYDCINKFQLNNIAMYLACNGNSLGNLIKVYSYLNTIIKENEEYERMNG